MQLVTYVHYVLLHFSLLKECKNFYNEAFANKFEEFLSREESASLTDFIHKDSSNYSYLNHIDHHLKSKRCPSFCSRLWLVKIIDLNQLTVTFCYCFRKFCTMKKICSPFQYADEGLLIFSVSSSVTSYAAMYVAISSYIVAATL